MEAALLQLYESFLQYQARSAVGAQRAAPGCGCFQAPNELMALKSGGIGFAFNALTHHPGRLRRPAPLPSPIPMGEGRGAPTGQVTLWTIENCVEMEPLKRFHCCTRQARQIFVGRAVSSPWCNVLETVPAGVGATFMVALVRQENESCLRAFPPPTEVGEGRRPPHPTSSERYQ